MVFPLSFVPLILHRAEKMTAEIHWLRPPCLMTVCAKPHCSTSRRNGQWSSCPRLLYQCELSILVDCTRLIQCACRMGPPSPNCRPLLSFPLENICSKHGTGKKVAQLSLYAPWRHSVSGGARPAILNSWACCVWVACLTFRLHYSGETHLDLRTL